MASLEEVVLTQPGVPIAPLACDNANGDLIVRANDLIHDEKGHTYRIIKKLGYGQFGQVFQVIEVFQNHQRSSPSSNRNEQDALTNISYALKISKSLPKIRQHIEKEASIFRYIQQESRFSNNVANRGHSDINANNSNSQEYDNFVHLYDTFTYNGHFCMLQELLSFDFHQIMMRHNFKGLKIALVQTTARQLLESLVVLKNLGIVHGDIKPENILLSDGFSDSVKIIDFGSAWVQPTTNSSPNSKNSNNPNNNSKENKNPPFYIQSRYYRAPEVVLRLPYGPSIDIWSLGCLLFELFIGLPLFPGQNEINLLQLIVESFGQIPPEMVASSPRREEFFDQNGFWKGENEICRQKNIPVVEGMRYFMYSEIDKLILEYRFGRGVTPEAQRQQTHFRRLFIDLLLKMLAVDPNQRISPEEALEHSFITTDMS
ncbi:CMGC family protein kinase [Tritrichomonas foetus]|uniref:CMGC family protein kinase n=1 Tax=Tritrichomonas foetus TaxID=1144522 RepID=A0A1J4KCU6_9EUKA|nr:CMGC family protein kinase [Tritrichomonas foetus]|eukprot:OHT09035.1 CMGC family protein kinase [Tritrichomonas foetus]